MGTSLSDATRRIIVGFPPGGVNDIYGRLIGQLLSERLGQSFVVENRPGAAGTIGVDSVVRAPADGYTLLLTSGNDAYNEMIYPDVRFSYIRDIAPVIHAPNKKTVMPFRVIPNLYSCNYSPLST
jgi:tripartite-type tricarboxylate transporter receptor subunit TctC